MEHLPLGVYVAVAMEDVIVDKDPLCHPQDLHHRLRENLWIAIKDLDYFTGIITHISTHRFFGLIKRKKPIYSVTIMFRNFDHEVIRTTNPRRITGDQHVGIT